jgi:hypothetical protein
VSLCSRRTNPEKMTDKANHVMELKRIELIQEKTAKTKKRFANDLGLKEYELSRTNGVTRYKVVAIIAIS